MASSASLESEGPNRSSDSCHIVPVPEPWEKGKSTDFPREESSSHQQVARADKLGSTGRLLKMQFARPCLGPTESESFGLKSRNWE